MVVLAAVLAAGTGAVSTAAAEGVPVGEPGTHVANAQSASCDVPADHDPDVIRTVYQVGKDRDVSGKVMLAAFEAGWVESHMNNLPCGHLDSVGVFQQRPSAGWCDTAAQCMNVRHASRRFFQRAEEVEPDCGSCTAGELAQRVQVSAFPDRYDQAEAKARALLREAREMVDVPAIRFDVFARGGGDRLVHRYYRGGEGWSDWNSLGGRLTSKPDVTSSSPGHLDVYAKSSDNTLIHRYYRSGDGWSRWVDLGGRLTSGPGVASWGPGRIDVFVRDHNNELAHRWYRSGVGWSDWESLGGRLTSKPDATSWGPGRLDVVAQGANNDILHWWFSGGEWHRETIAANITHDPSVTSAGVGRVDVYAREAGSGHLVHKWYRSGTGWHGFTDIGGRLDGGPGAASWRFNRMDVFVRGTNDNLYHTFYSYRNDNGWHDFVNLGGDLTSSPAAVSWNRR